MTSLYVIPLAMFQDSNAKSTTDSGDVKLYDERCYSWGRWTAIYDRCRCRYRWRILYLPGRLGLANPRLNP